LNVPLDAQDISGRVVLYGRAVDSATRQPIQGARLVAADSSWSTLSDADGSFTLPLPPGNVLTVVAEAFGYRPQRFDLAASAASRLAVLLLEPTPVEIEGITVVEEAAVITLQRNLRQRRNAYPHAMVALDRTVLDRFPAASAYDVIRTRVPRVMSCRHDPSQICVPGRARTFDNPEPELMVAVCVDGWRSISSIAELETLSIESVALVEIYLGGPGAQVRVYTARWMVTQAAAERTHVLPLFMGC
jgi:hypothetical protein